MKKQISPKIVSLIFAILVICFAIAFYVVAQWTEPGVGPPGGNVPAPLNTGLIDQVKEGALGIYGVFRAVGGADPAIEPGLVVNNGNVGIGTTDPQAKLHVAGTAGTDGIIFPDGTLQTTAAAGGIEIIAVHSQTSSIPACPSGWENLWNGYSLTGSALSPGYEAFNDLGSSGSCVEEFYPIPFIECSGPTNCDYFNGGDYAMWLTTTTINTGGISGISNILPYISRCSVCKKSAKLVVKHSLSTTVPSCPAGATQLWNGYSLHGMYLGGGYNSVQDLKSPGSCSQEFRPIPFIECSGPTNCDYFTGGDFGMWLTTTTINTGGISGISNILPYISRCVVCEY